MTELRHLNVEGAGWLGSFSHSKHATASLSQRSVLCSFKCIQQTAPSAFDLQSHEHETETSSRNRWNVNL